MNLLIADGHELVRDTIKAFLEQSGRARITVAGDLPTALALMVTDGPYDLVILDHDMLGMGRLDGLSEALSRSQGKPVAIMSGCGSRGLSDAVLTAGGAGFVPKSMPARALVHAISFMVAGEIYVPFAYFGREPAAVCDLRMALLSPGELDVAKGLVECRSNKDIARRLDLPEQTIKQHVKVICRKWEAGNRVQAAMIARTLGIVGGRAPIPA
jgi:DNA-binding NarL/FixJ family response regulator